MFPFLFLLYFLVFERDGEAEKRRGQLLQVESARQESGWAHVEITPIVRLWHACRHGASALPASYQSSPCCGTLQSPRDAGDEGMGSLVSKEVSGVRAQRAELLTGFLKNMGKELLHALVDWRLPHRASSTPLPANTSQPTPAPRACLEVLSLVVHRGAFSWHLHGTSTSTSVRYTVLFGYSFFFFLLNSLQVLWRQRLSCYSRIPTMGTSLHIVDNCYIFLNEWIFDFFPSKEVWLCDTGWGPAILMFNRYTKSHQMVGSKTLE